jgi:RNA polymerase sigma-70 factor (ECF subfamily)
MAEETEPTRLSDVPTRKDLLEPARGEDAAAADARKQLLLLYYGAARRYFLGALRDPEASEDLAQQFAIRFLEGDYVKRANPEKGRFRDYLKRCLQNAVIDHLRREGHGPRPLPEDSGAWEPPEAPAAAEDEAFLSSLRDELIACTWKALAQYQQDTATPYEVVLRLKVQQPRLRAATIAESLGAELGRSFTGEGIRQILKRARDIFARLLVENVRCALKVTDRPALEEQLVDLRLLKFCGPALTESE